FHKASDAMMQTVIVNVWNLFCTGLALWLVDRVGRRPLLLVGTAGMTFGQLLMGIFFALKLTGIYVVVTMMICVAFYVTSLAPLAGTCRCCGALNLLQNTTVFSPCGFRTGSFRFQQPALVAELKLFSSLGL